MTTTPTIPPTAEELALARKIAADQLIRPESWLPGVKAGMHDEIIIGIHDGEAIVRIALAAIRETTERAAEWLQSEANELFRDEADKAGEELQQAAQCLRNNEHLEDNDYD